MVKIASTNNKSSSNSKKKRVLPAVTDKKGKKKKKQIAPNNEMGEDEMNEFYTRLCTERMRKSLEENLEFQARYEKLIKEKEIEALKKQILAIGYVFSPMEGQLVDYYLRNKNLCNPMDHCPIEEVNVYANHPQSLAEKCPNSAEVWYFFTRSRPNEIQPGTDVQGQWVFCEKKDVFNQGEKVGVKQVLEYYEEGRKNKYKIIEYQLDPAPENIETGLWFVCKLYSCMDEQCQMPQLGATAL
ncbi:hypothetical protein FRX31_025419 [Thalictrum thalictroides]|uniref:NAC domain-containing protein n=1 Tax=Thalictrum thalictroides TaxID=46969 RepID=A0A7J6VLE9_THATH|nr:hypothetical protein FRX31_025419 [Thalictrum thalictroides]